MQHPPAAADSAIILVNLGTPQAATASAVGAFLAEFLSDRRVVELPALLWKPLLRLLVIPLRARRVAAAYRSIWAGGSPLAVISQRQQQGLQALLDAAHGARAPRVFFAMSYQGPAIGRVLDECLASGIEQVCVLPLYPQYSATTTAVVYDQLGRYFPTRRLLPHLRVVRDYHDHPAYIGALAQTVREHWLARGREAHLLMSFHGIPQANVDRGDPYAAQCERSAQLLAAELSLAPDRWTLAYQSRFGRARWLQPYTSETLAALASDGVLAIDVICPAFASDCLETLEEMAVENRDLFLHSGGQDYALVPCLNDRPEHLRMMCELVQPTGLIASREYSA